MVTRSQSGIVKPVDRLSLHTSSISPIPKSLFLALKDPHWCNAMYVEYNVLVKNSTWILVPRPSGVNLVRSMWSFKHKFHADGTLSRYKARLVANVSSQQLGVDFDETFSSVFKLATIRTVLSLVMYRKWPIHQLHVKNAFLNSDISETVYMHQPRGFIDSRLCHMGRILSQPLRFFIVYYRQGSQVAYLLIYVDDIILTASSPALLQQIIDSLHSEFDMTDLGALNYFLGISIVRHPTGFAEAEYRGVANVVAETTWLRNMLPELHSPLSTATLVYCDNVSAIYMSANPVQHQRTKHIEIDIYFVCDMGTAG
ncbi:ribonuclease H-like domain-containing protein [Tanacetum coccineum]